MSLSAAEASDLFRRPPERFLDVGNGAEVAYRTVGTGPDVLFVHGWPVSGATFRLLLPHLADHVTCHLLDLPGAGSSRYSDATPLSIRLHIESVRKSIELLGLDDVAVVGHDSGGMIARHAVAGHPSLRAMGLIDTEHPNKPTLKFRSFVAGRFAPGFGAALGWLAGKPKLRRHPLVLGDAFADRSQLDGEFDEFFLRRLNQDRRYRAGMMKLLKTFSFDDVRALKDLHAKIDVPVELVWGELDKFFPVERAKEMVSEFPNAHLSVISGAGLFSHEERPADVAAALLPVLSAPRAG
jgi:pimeloyl-ACP methyl ester carboxylesterase